MNCFSISQNHTPFSIGHSLQNPMKWCCRKVIQIKEPLNTQGLWQSAEVARKITLLLGGLVLFTPSLLLFLAGKCFTVLSSDSSQLHDSSIQEKELPQPSNPTEIQNIDEIEIEEKSPIESEKEVDLTNQLSNFRLEDPEKYPSYLEKLKENGYVHLCNHLLRMKAFSTRHERVAEIKKISFSQLSHIVLEARKAIIQKVENFIEGHPGSENLVFLLGGTGAGKSTILCFLRKDEMVLKNFCYESKNDKNGIIGDESATSCTFLPNLEMINGLVIIDFPGFEDTHGKLISLGTELALKALLKKYPAKILLIESITNREGRYNSIDRLGFRLNRILSNKQNCMMGLTKYTQESNFIRIQAIEKEQIAERLNPTNKECQLSGKVGALDLVIQLHPTEAPNLLIKKEKKERKLEKLKQERLQKQDQPLPETEEKLLRRKQIEEAEAQMVNHAGVKLESIIRFSDLEDSNCLTSCLEKLSDPSVEVVSVNSKLVLDAADRSFLDDRFMNDMIKKLEVIDFRSQFNDFESFKQSVIKSSLIYTISQSSPEIGEFLLLPEIDPCIVREYDKILISDCIKKYKEAIIGTLSTTIDEMLDVCTSSLEKKIELKTKLNNIRKYLLRLEGKIHSEDPKEMEKEWKSIQLKNSNLIETLKANIRLPRWASVIFKTTVYPKEIFGLLAKSRLKNEQRQLTNDLFDRCSKELDEMHATLAGFIDIEKIVLRD